MLTQTRGRICFAAAALAVPASAAAHGFGRLYNLPVPFWLYAWGAGAALILSFLMVGVFATGPDPAAPPPSRDLTHSVGARLLRRVRPALRVLGVFVLLLCIVTGFLGSRDPYLNFSMTFFWVVFLLLFTYLTALVGDFYAALNPWRSLADAADRLRRGFSRGRLRYPERLGDAPALALYLGFIAFELFGHGRPPSLATLLVGYTLLNLAGVGLVGATAWFRHCEFFSLYLRLIALMAPLDYRPGADGARATLRWRRPLMGLVQERPERLSTVVFALAMLSTTAYDGLRSTLPWVQLFWNDPTGIVTAIVGGPPIQFYSTLVYVYFRWEAVCLLLSPLLYLAAYLLCLEAARRLTRTARTLRELALDFGYTLLPIALVYHATHYATLILTQGLKIVSLLSDPFGWGWNLLGTAGLWRAPILPEMGWVWHTQVVLILIGHVASLYVAHRVALRVFPTRGPALLSQLPMLVLMVGLTVAGLWIIAQPLTTIAMR